MKLDKTGYSELRRTFLLEALPEPLTRASAHIQLFDNYIIETRLRIRSIRVPETKKWSRVLQQRRAVNDRFSEWKVVDMHLNDAEYEHFKIFEGLEIRKNRYFHEFDAKMIAFDLYLGELWGLNRALVEFDTPEELADYIPPPWAVYEITGSPALLDESLVGKRFEAVQAEVARLDAAQPLDRELEYLE